MGIGITKTKTSSNLTDLRTSFARGKPSRFTDSPLVMLYHRCNRFAVIY